jgi:hypothetical protein
MDRLEELEKQIADMKSQNAYEKTRAESEVHEMSVIAQSPQKTLNVKLSEKLAHEIETSEEVDKKVAETTQILVDKGLEEQQNKAVASVIRSEDETLDADFEKNKNEYLYHGINHKIDKKWKRTLVHIINDIWFVIWAIVGCFTIVPVSTFLSRINELKGFIKGVAIVLGILLGLACMWALTYACLKWCGVPIKIKRR